MDYWFPSINRDNIEKSFAFGFYLRNYITVNQGGLFLEESMSFGFSKSEFIDFEDNNTSSRSFSIGISPGIYYYLTEKIALEAKIGWLGYKTKREIYSYRDYDRVFNESGVSINPQNITMGIIFTLK